MITVTDSGKFKLVLEMEPSDFYHLQRSILDLICCYDLSMIDQENNVFFWVLRVFFEQTLLSENQLNTLAKHL